jgi:MFS family permease
MHFNAMPETKAQINSQYLKLLFFLLLGATIADKLYALISIGFAYTDADQTLIWNAAYDMLHGRFYEPCFYGQSYNPLIESFLAVPLMALHVKPYIALPIITAILGLLPYLLFGMLCYRKGWFLLASICIGVPLLMPFGFEMLTMMPRGFVTGIAFAAIGSAFVLFGNGRFRFLLFAFFSVVALTSNPNSGLIIFPVLCFALFENYSSRITYTQLSIGALLAAPLPLFIYFFYTWHPELIVHSQKSKGFVYELLIDGLKHSGIFLHDVLPFGASMWFVVLLLLVIAILAFRNPTLLKSVIIAIATFIVFLLSFGIEKVHDGRPVIFLPYSRMYMALPFVIIVIAIISGRYYKLNYNLTNPLTALLLIAAITGTIIRYNGYQSKLANDIANSRTVPARPVAAICDSCMMLEKLSQQYHAQTVAFYGYTKQYCYGCAALGYQFQTIFPLEDRRVWVVRQEKIATEKSILLWPEDTAFTVLAAAKCIPCRKVNKTPAIYLLETQGRSTIQLMKELGLPLEFKF